MIIDAHCHLGDEEPKRQSVDGLLRRMDACSVDRAVVCPSDREIAVLNDAGNRRLAAAVESHPDRLIGMAVANPWFGEEALSLLRHALDRPGSARVLFGSDCGAAGSERMLRERSRGSGPCVTGGCAALDFTPFVG